MSNSLDTTKIKPEQIESTKTGYESLREQLEFGRFNSIKSAAAPTLFDEIISVEGQREFKMQSGQYVIGDHSLQVFVNGQLMRVGEDNDYIETTNTSITFNFDMDEDEIIVLRVNGGTSGPSLHESYIVDSEQIVFDLVTSYTTNNNSLTVFVSGAYQTVNVDYIETDAKTVTFLDPLEIGDLVTFRVEGIPSIESKYKEKHTARLYDQAGHLLKEEETGDGVHVVREYQRDAQGKPESMTIKESGFVIKRTYTWDGYKCIHINEEVREGS